MNRLNDIPSGKNVVLVSIDGSNCTDAPNCAEKRLIAMGFLPGETIYVISNSRVGHITVLLKGSKLALGHGLAKKLVVKDTKCNEVF